MPHEKFKRRGNDLIYQHKISLVDSLCAKTFNLETIDHRVIIVSLDNIVIPGTKKLIEGEGMPICKTGEEDILNAYRGAPKTKGDLFITFDIIFPTKIDPDKKELLKELLLQ